MIFQIRKWIGGASSVTVHKSDGRFKRTIKELFLYLIVQKKLLKADSNSIILWVTCWLVFHIPLFFILFGHLRSIGVWSVDWFTGLVSRDFLVDTLPFAMGIIVLSGIILLTLRRIVFSNPRAISTPQNYTVLLLLIMVLVAGMVMRILPHSPETSLVIPPGITMTLEHTPSLVWFTIHALIAQIIVMYIPFSGLIHIISGIITTISCARGEYYDRGKARRAVPSK
jgi:nitrate reductase gamma subunit